MTIRLSSLGIVFAGALVFGCTSSGQRPPAERPQRIPDSPPEKAAALRSASGLHQEEDEQRWGVEAARARKQNAETPAQPAPANTKLTAPTPSP